MRDNRGLTPTCGREFLAARWSSYRCAQPGDAHQVIGGAHQVSSQLSELAASITSAPEVGGGLDPAEDLFHPLALFLADAVARVPQYAFVQHRTAPAAVIGSHVWGNVQRPTSRDEAGGIISLVCAQGDAPGSRQGVLDHLDCGAALGRPVGFDNLKVDQQPIAVLHQRIARVTKPSLLARTLAPTALRG